MAEESPSPPESSAVPSQQPGLPEASSAAGAEASSAAGAEASSAAAAEAAPLPASHWAEPPDGPTTANADPEKVFHGIWAIDFADQFPNANVIGTDISPIQPYWTPPNVRFEIDDATLEWTYKPNSFDYVHMRYLLGSIIDWTALFNQAYKVLKPGGYLESYEASVRQESDDGSIPPGSAMDQWGKLFWEAGRKLRRSFRVYQDNLQVKAMEEAGFVDIQVWEFKAPIGGWPADPKLREIGEFAQMCTEADIEGYILFVCHTVLGWSKEEVSVFVAHWRRQVRSKKTHAFYRQRVVWGRKPEAA
ncbi:hypothetical protein DL765_008599 [Monosporascus sp. GIB2]|nr:hypothetical protein DL765_008599 [Monosporascus sp. GIB2]